MAFQVLRFPIYQPSPEITSSRSKWIAELRRHFDEFPCNSHNKISSNQAFAEEVVQGNVKFRGSRPCSCCLQEQPHSLVIEWTFRTASVLCEPFCGGVWVCGFAAICPAIWSASLQGSSLNCSQKVSIYRYYFLIGKRAFHQITVSMCSRLLAVRRLRCHFFSRSKNLELPKTDFASFVDFWSPTNKIQWFVWASQGGFKV